MKTSNVDPLFSKTGIIFRFFGKTPVEKERLIIPLSMNDSSFLIRLRIWNGMLLGPVDFFVSSEFIQFKISKELTGVRKIELGLD